MSDDLENEIQAISSIYGDSALRTLNADGTYALSIPGQDVVLRLSFGPSYPQSPPQIEGVEATGSKTRKGHGNNILHMARDILQETFIPGSVCLFDLLQELDARLCGGGGDHHHHLVIAEEEPGTRNGPDTAKEEVQSVDDDPLSLLLPPSLEPTEPDPQWTLSDPITEKKSVFVARACTVTTPAHAKACLAHLLATDKRAAKATHNISAYRIRHRRPPAAEGSGNTITSPTTTIMNVYQDCDDDGETAAGGRLLHLLQIMDAWGVLVVVSRWYGGVKLGPDRFRIINGVAREVVVLGGWGRRG